MNTLLLIFLAASAIFIAADAWWQYRVNPNEGILSAFYDSATILWARVLAFAGVLVGMGVDLSDYLGQPAIADAIKSYIKPEYVPLFVIFTGVITELARRRSK